jgi:hypothetical protein
VNESPHALYRYLDAECVLLYIGKSSALAERQQSHIARAKWMQFAASSTIERHETPQGLAAAERIAIEAEHPIFNKQYNDTPEARRRLCDYLERVGRLDLLPPLPQPRPQRRRSEPAHSAKREPRGCWDEDGHRPWVPGFIGWPEAHDQCPPGACLGRTIPAAVRIRIRELREANGPLTREEILRVAAETARPLWKAPPTGEAARRLIAAAAGTEPGA